MTRRDEAGPGAVLGDLGVAPGEPGGQLIGWGALRRSQINAAIEAAEKLFADHRIALPPFCHWAPSAFKGETGRVVPAGLGWDVTDYGAGRFEEMGLTLVTLRNGDLRELRDGGGLCYAEKLLVSRQDQLSPLHTHRRKVEDIINRGGATLAVQLYGSDEEGALAENRGVAVQTDGVVRDLAPGDVLRLVPGESVTLRPGDWHAFWGEGGAVVAGEVSSVNDDHTDNVFRDAIGRFSDVDEDAAPYRLLVSDYPQA